METFYFSDFKELINSNLTTNGAKKTIKNKTGIKEENQRIKIETISFYKVLTNLMTIIISGKILK